MACILERQTTSVNSITPEHQYQLADFDRRKERQRARSSQMGRRAVPGRKGGSREVRHAQRRKIDFDAEYFFCV